MDVTVTGFTHSPRRFDQLVQAINEAERLLDAPYPSPRVTLKRVSTVSGGFCGQNVVYNSTIEVRVDDECDDTLAMLAHEVAHTWFHGSNPANWIDEGLANAIERQVVKNLGADEPAYRPITYCETYRNLRELEQGRPNRVTRNSYAGFSCNYSLGDGIFGALMEYYGEEEFNRRIAQLARPAISRASREHTIADVRETLGDDGPALEIIDLWYQGEPEMRKYRHLDAIEWSYPPTIDGDYLHFAGSSSQPDMVYDFILGKDPYCSQFLLYDGIGRSSWVASVADPLPAGWHRDDISELVVINHQINPATGQFSVTAQINGPALAEVADLSLSVRSRVTTGADGFCEESISYSQGPIVTGVIPIELKEFRHYHLDAIEWISPPKISGNVLRFAGKALPGAVQLTWREDYCGQFDLYYRDERGYHYIDSINPLLPDDRFWPEQIAAEVTAQRVGGDGAFEALVRISDNDLLERPDLILLVETEAEWNRNTRKCGDSAVLSAVDIR